MAIADKTWPALLAPVLLWRVPTPRGRIVYAALAALPPIGALLLYEVIVPGGAAHALRVVSGYQGVIGAWGFSELLVRTAGADGRDEAVRRGATAGVGVVAGGRRLG